MEKDERITRKMRKLGAKNIQFQQVAAASLHIATSDFIALDILQKQGPLTAGELGRYLNLTTGSTTTLIDRLEKNNFAHRTYDKSDRRKVLIVPSYEDKDEVKKTYNGLHQAMLKVANTYDEKDLDIILRFLEKATEVIEQETLKLQNNKIGE